MGPSIAIGALMGVTALAASSAPVLAQSGPAKPVRLIIGFAAGGGGEAMLRIVTGRVTERGGASFIVDHRPGASGNIAAAELVRAAPDGNTILYMPAALAVNPSLFPKVPYDLARDFAPITLVATFPLVLVVHPSLPVKSVAELVALARRKPDSLNYASIGAASPPHLAGELFNQLAGVKMTHVPYKGSAPAEIDLAGGHVELMFNTAISAMPNIRSGRTRAIAVSTAERSRLLPQLPTIAQTVPGFDLYGWGGLVGPGGMPAEAAGSLQQAIARALREADIAEKLMALGAEPSGMAPAEFGRFIQSEAAKWRKLVVASGAKAE
jgi:tripartite-type tricarboxylate transporter receptor subunit TctC